MLLDEAQRVAQLEVEAQSGGAGIPIADHSTPDEPDLPSPGPCAQPEIRLLAVGEELLVEEADVLEAAAAQAQQGAVAEVGALESLTAPYSSQIGAEDPVHRR